MVQNSLQMKTIDLFTDFEPALATDTGVTEKSDNKTPINKSRNKSCLFCGKVFIYTFETWSTLRSVLYCNADHKSKYINSMVQNP